MLNYVTGFITECTPAQKEQIYVNPARQCWVSWQIGARSGDGKKTQETKMKTEILFLLIALLGLSTVACNKNPAETASQSPSKHYHLKGKVVSIDKQGKMLNVDSETIPGFMDAMTMPYKIKPESGLDKLHPGDAITADLIVQDENAWLENITVTGHTAAPSSK